MANCKRCDRCGWCYDRVEHGSAIVTMSIFGHGDLKGFDLCPECTETLIKWLNVSKKEEKSDD